MEYLTAYLDNHIILHAYFVDSFSDRLINSVDKAID